MERIGINDIKQVDCINSNCNCLKYRNEDERTSSFNDSTYANSVINSTHSYNNSNQSNICPYNFNINNNYFYNNNYFFYCYNPNCRNNTYQNGLIPNSFLTQDSLLLTQVQLTQKKHNKKHNKFSYFNPKSSLKSNHRPIDFEAYLNQIQVGLTSYLCTHFGAKEVYSEIIKFPDKTTENIDLLLSKIVKDLHKVMKDQNGNYFVQNIIKFSSGEQLRTMVSCIRNKVAEIANNSSGTHVLQLLFMSLGDCEDFGMIMERIENDVLDMALNINGRHVLSLLLSKVPDTSRKEVNEILLQNLKLLSVNSNGSCLLKKFMELTTIQNNKQRLLDFYYDNCLSLSKNEFGNFCLQYIYEIWPLSECEKITEKIIENAFELSLNRIGYNVVGKSIDNFDEKNSAILVRKLLFDNEKEILLINKYGRYVFKKAMRNVDDETKRSVKIDARIINDYDVDPKEKAEIIKLLGYLNLKAN